eukprot:6315-Heterococcus_DN1.PRE.3
MKTKGALSPSKSKALSLRAARPCSAMWSTLPAAASTSNTSACSSCRALAPALTFRLSVKYCAPLTAKLLLPASLTTSRSSKRTLGSARAATYAVSASSEASSSESSAKKCPASTATAAAALLAAAAAVAPTVEPLSLASEADVAGDPCGAAVSAKFPRKTLTS